MTPGHIKTRMGLAEWSMLIALSVIWGGSYFLIEIALREWTPMLIVAVRIAIATTVVWTVVLLAGMRIPRSREAWTAFATMAFINNVIPFVLIVWGQKEITAGLAAILNAATPIFTVIVAGIFLKDEPMTASKLFGAILGLVGVVVLMGPSALSGIDANLLAQIAVVAAALSYALAGVYGRRFTSMNINPMVTAAGQLLMSSIIMIALATTFESPSLMMTSSAQVWIAVVAMAVVSTAFAYILYFRLLATAGATNALLVTLLIPVTAIVLGGVFLDERLAAIHFVGMGIIAVGLLIIDGRVFARSGEKE
jgi:drug/metabolite transporter (DMT)-like permease